MIDALLSGILDFINNVSTSVLSPIDTYILQNMPALASVISSIVSFFTYILDFVRWACSTVGLDYDLINLIFSYIEFKITVSWLVSGIKHLIKIFKTFKL